MWKTQLISRPYANVNADERGQPFLPRHAWGILFKSAKDGMPTTMSQENKLKVTSPLYLFRSTSDCWRCGANQDVIALATRRVIEPDVDEEDSLGEEDEPVILNNIGQIPEAILRHILATHPAFEKRTSRTAGNAYYMNTCSCGAHFGDFYLHSEPGGAFFPDTEEDASRIV